jgi:septum formation protein
MSCLILASASPRRAELLRQIGADFQVAPAEIDETPQPDEAAQHYVERLAREKALCVADGAPGARVLGSDTSVVVDGEILGKPESEAQACAMLRRLSVR